MLRNSIVFAAMLMCCHAQTGRTPREVSPEIVQQMRREAISGMSPAERELRLKLEIAQSELGAALRDKAALQKRLIDQSKSKAASSATDDARVTTNAVLDAADAAALAANDAKAVAEANRKTAMNWWSTFSATATANGGFLVIASGLCWLIVKLTTRNEVLEANAKQLVQINGTYVRSNGATISGSEIARLMGEVGGKLDALYMYTHTSVHNLNNAVHKLLQHNDIEDRAIEDKVLELRAKLKQDEPGGEPLE